MMQGGVAYYIRSWNIKGMIAYIIRTNLEKVKFAMKPDIPEPGSFRIRLQVTQVSLGSR